MKSGQKCVESFWFTTSFAQNNELKPVAFRFRTINWGKCKSIDDKGDDRIMTDKKQDLPDETADVGLHPDPEPSETSNPGIKPAETQHPDPDPEELETDPADQ